MDEGSQYDVKLALEDSGTGTLKIKDLVITEPLDPDQAYPGQISIHFNLYTRDTNCV